MAEDENRAAFGRLCRAVLDEILNDRAGLIHVAKHRTTHRTSFFVRFRGNEARYDALGTSR
jgi:hypothetical protein